MNPIGWALLGVLVAFVVRWAVRRRGLQTGALVRCPHCGVPLKGDPIYCPECGGMVKHGSHRR